jgi:hypothetical protein
MLTTVLIGTCVSVQGHFVARLDNGLVMVRVDDKIYTGRPIITQQAA